MNKYNSSNGIKLLIKAVIFVFTNFSVLPLCSWLSMKMIFY